MSSKVLLTGGSGFVGGFVAERLVATGKHVRALVRPTSDTSLLRKLDVELVEGDLRDAESVKRAAHGCELVHHAAAMINRRANRLDDLRATNTQGTQHIGRAAIEAGVRRIVHVSTCGVYGDTRAETVDEISPPRPDTLYGRSKLEAERTIQSLCRESGIELVIVRLPHVMGPRSTRWIGMAAMAARGSFRMIGRGENWYHLGDVRDVADGLMLAADADRAAGRTYILAAAEPIRTRDLMALIAGEFGQKLARAHVPAAPYWLADKMQRFTSRWLGFRFPPTRDNALFLASRRLSIEAARRDLGFEPKFDAAQSVRDTVAWLREAGLLRGHAAAEVNRT